VPELCQNVTGPLTWQLANFLRRCKARHMLYGTQSNLHLEHTMNA
jgi:hypothetical protein